MFLATWLFQIIHILRVNKYIVEMKCSGEQEGVVPKPKENLIILFPLLAEVSHST